MRKPSAIRRRFATTAVVLLVLTPLLAATAAGAPSQGKTYLSFEGGPDGHKSAVQVVAFNLSWLLNGRDLAEL